MIAPSASIVYQVLVFLLLLSQTTKKLLNIRINQICKLPNPPPPKKKSCNYHMGNLFVVKNTLDECNSLFPLPPSIPPGVSSGRICSAATIAFHLSVLLKCKTQKRNDLTMKTIKILTAGWHN